MADPDAERRKRRMGASASTTTAATALARPPAAAACYLWLLLLPLCGVVIFPPLAAAQEGGSGSTASVHLEQLELFTTHDLPLWTPTVYFQCDGEPKRYLTGVTAKSIVYNFSFHESFQPLTELQTPKCKRCGLYEEDTWKHDDTFDAWELCPLEFTPAPEGRLTRYAEKEFRLTLHCANCNLVHSRTSGESFGGDTADTVNPFVVAFAVLGIATTLSLLVCAVALWIQRGNWPFRRRLDADTIKFMEMFDAEDDDLLEEPHSDSELEMGDRRQGDGLDKRVT